MMRLNFLRPITPRCWKTGAKYMLIAVDYFTRYTWVRPCKAADGRHVVDFFENFISPNFGFPHSLYTDNGTHFTGAPASDYFRDKRILHYDAPVSHPSSVGLVERTVQLVVSRTRAYAIEQGQYGTDSWGLSAGPTMLAINTRLVKIHGFTPDELMFGYRPKGSWMRRLHNDEDPETEDPEEYAPHLSRLYAERRDELREDARATMAAVHKKMEAVRRPVWTTPKEGD